MTHNFNDLLNDIKQIKKAFKQLDYRTNVLYKTQWEEKVVNGYQKWRFDPDGGLKLVKEQLKKLDNKCPVCHVTMSETSVTLDHMQPKSKYLGAAINPKNMLIMCQSCNSAKNNQEFEAWYLKLPPVWQERLDRAIEEIHGTAKLIKLLPHKHNRQKIIK